jgi:glyoxylate carboligase
MSPNPAKTGAQVVVELLERHGVKYVFGIPGAKIDKVFDTLKSSSVETVVCWHEQIAAFIAGGMGRLTGKAGVAIATVSLTLNSKDRRCAVLRHRVRSWPVVQAWRRSPCRQERCALHGRSSRAEFIP